MYPECQSGTGEGLYLSVLTLIQVISVHLRELTSRTVPAG